MLPREDLRTKDRPTGGLEVGPAPSPSLGDLIRVGEQPNVQPPERRTARWGGRRDDGRRPLRRFSTRLLRVGFTLFLIQLLLFNFSVVRGSSMLPGIHDGDRILVDQVSYLFSEVERGDVVVLRYPLDPSLDYIKRVVGLPGDEVELAHGRVWVNGHLLDEPYVHPAKKNLRYLARVRPGHYFVLGDNRPHSSDSREFGQVSEELLRGRVDLRVWPPSRAGRVR